MSAVEISRGRAIPETENERVAEAIKQFNKTAGPRILEALGALIRGNASGWVRPNIRVTNGRPTSVQLVCEVTIDLDAAPE